MIRSLRTALMVAAIALPLAACGGRGNKTVASADLAASKITTIGVNSYLWRASLDTLSFMPLLQTDSNGGVIVTDWYVNPQVPTERMKVTVSILDQGPAGRCAPRRGAARSEPRRPVGVGAGAGRDDAEAGRHHPHPRPRPAPGVYRGLMLPAVPGPLAAGTALITEIAE